MNYFKILAKNLVVNNDVSNAINLHVISDNGFNVKPDLNINITDLNRDVKTGLLYKHFFNNGSTGITFEIEVIIGRDELWNNVKVTKQLSDWINNMKPIWVVTDAIDIPNDTYIIIGNDSRKQVYDTHTVWKLKFITYTPLVTYKYKNTNTNVLKALKKFETARLHSTPSWKLSQCKTKKLKYKLKNKCVGYLNTVLSSKGYLSKKKYKAMIKNGKDTTFTKDTKNAVKKFQKAYNKKKPKKKLKVTGKVNAATLKALCK